MRIHHASKILKPWLLGAAALALALPLLEAQEADAPAGEDEIAALTAALFEAEGGEDFQTTLAKAQKAGVPEQALLEARFLHLIDLQDHSGIARLAPELVARRKNFQVSESRIFSLQEEWDAVVEYALALAALEKGDEAAFKRHILEAFWLSPRQAGIFAPHIEKLRLEEAMADVRVDLTTEYARQDKVGKASLGELAQDSPALLLHFWSPWSRECEMLLEDFIATADALSKKNIAVVSVLADPAPEVLPDANSYQSAVNNRAASSWIIDDEESTLTRLLRIPDLPTMVVVDRAGKIHFNGHPSDPKLWQALRKFVPSLKRPALPEPGPSPAP